MTGVVVASVQSVDRTPFGMYAVVAVLTVVAIGTFCVLGVVSWGRFLGWLDGRETHRREHKLALRHQAHYRTCGCLGRSNQCCDDYCACQSTDRVLATAGQVQR